MKRAVVFCLLFLLSGHASAFTWSSAAEKTLEQMLDTSGKMSILTMNGRAIAPALSPTGQGSIYYDTAAAGFKISSNGNAYATLVSADSPVFTTKILLPDGTASAPSMAWNSQTNTGIYRAGANDLSIASNGSRVVAFSSADVYFLTAAPRILFGASSDTILTRFAAANWQLGAAASATPVAYTLSVQDGVGTDIAGTAWTLRANRATGAGTPGTIVLAASAAALGTGTTLQTAVSHQTIGGGWTIFGSVLFANLGTPANGAVTFCSNCDPPTLVDQTCTSVGTQTGSIAVRTNGAWKCIS